MKTITTTLLITLLAVFTTQAAEPTQADIIMANEWSRQAARETMQARVKRQSFMRVEAFARFTAKEEFPNDSAKQQWFIEYVVPLTDAIMIYASQTILNIESEVTSSNLFRFFVILKDNPQDIEELAKLINETE